MTVRNIGKEWDRSRDWDAICGSCGDTFLASEGTPHSFVFNSKLTQVSVTVIWCDYCANEVPCNANTRGIHGEVTVLSEEEEKGITITLGDDHPFADVPRHQVGYCCECKVIMVWSVRDQHWKTCPDELIAEAFDPLLSRVPLSVLNQNSPQAFS